MLDIYTDKCKNGPYFKNGKKSDIQIRNFIKKQMQQKQEWYMSAEEAVNYGFTDYILGDKKCPILKEIVNI